MNHRRKPITISARRNHRGLRLLPLMAFVLWVDACRDQTPAQPEFSPALALIAGPATAPATGPLRVDPTNPRYFSDGSKIVYLSGSHTWQTLKDRALNDPPPLFDYDAFLSFLVSHNHNFFRLWTWEQTYSWNNNTDGNKRYFTPFPWQRTGPGNANDGKPRFDLTKFDQAYFDRLRARVVAARNRGVYVAITLFDGWDVVSAFNATNGGFPYGPGNNVNGIGVGGVESQTLNNSAVTQIQDAYVRKVIDAVNDLENVLYEIANESDNGSVAWQYHMIALIKQYEAGKPQRHPVGMSKTISGSDAELMNSNADWIAPATAVLASDGHKVVINDTDHSYYWTALKADGTDAQRRWAWKNLTVGASLLFMDPYLEAWPGRNSPNGSAVDPYWEPLRSALGYVRSYADRLDLRNAVPRSDLSSTGYCLAKVGAQYLAYQPSSGSFTVSVDAGTYGYEWFDAKRGTVAGTGSVTLSTGPNTFTPPFAGDAVLFLERTGSSPPPSSFVVGESTILPTDDNGNGNLLVAQTVNLATSATLRSLSFYVTNAAGKLRLGVYDASGPSGGPGSKRAETSEFTPVSGWNTASTPPVVLAAGTYWLAYFASDNALGFRKQSGSAGSKLASVSYGVLPAAFPASPRTSGSKWSLFATFDVATANQPPTLTRAIANPSVVTGTTTALSTSGSDDQGEPGLSYTWSTRSSPPAAVSFSSNGVNASKNTTATFSGPGTYALRATARDGQGLTATSDVDVTVNATLTSVSVTPSSATIATGATQQFTASGRDQFGVALVNQPVFAWSTSGGGTINAAGVYSAGMTSGGPYSVAARSGTTSGTASVTISNAPPATVTFGETTVLSVDDDGNANLLIAQPTSLTQTVTVRSLSFYVATPAGKLRLGIYDASGPMGGPGAKRAETNEIVIGSAGWATGNVITPVTLTPGSYWLAYLPSDNRLHFRKQPNSSNAKLYAFPYGPLPATFSTSPNTSTSHWSLFASGTP